MEGAALPAGGLAGLLLEGLAAGVLLLVVALAAAVLEEVPVADPLPEGAAASAWPLPGAAGTAGLTGEGAPLPAGGPAGSALCCSAAGVAPEAKWSSNLVPESGDS